MRRELVVLACVAAGAVFGAGIGGASGAWAEPADVGEREGRRAAGGWAIRTIAPLWSEASAVNDRGQVVGTLGVQRPGDNPTAHAFLWSAGKLRDLGTLPLGGRGDMPNTSEAWALNDRGDVVGTSYVSANDPEYHAFVWRNGTMTDLGAGFARAIDGRGNVVGSRGGRSSGEDARATLWRGGRRIDLGTLGRSFSEAVAVNGRGQIVGNTYGIGPELLHVRLRPFVWQNGSLRALRLQPAARAAEVLAINEQGQILGVASGRGLFWPSAAAAPVRLAMTIPTDVNDRGQVVGYAGTTSGASRAVLWQRGRLTDLGTLGGAESSAKAINERGQIVGSSTTRSGAWHAFIWERGRMTDLGTRAGDDTSIAVDIDERGRVVGSSGRQNAGTTGLRAVLWTRRG